MNDRPGGVRRLHGYRLLVICGVASHDRSSRRAHPAAFRPLTLLVGWPRLSLPPSDLFAKLVEFGQDLLHESLELLELGTFFAANHHTRVAV